METTRRRVAVTSALPVPPRAWRAPPAGRALQRVAICLLASRTALEDVAAGVRVGAERAAADSRWIPANDVVAEGMAVAVQEDDPTARGTGIPLDLIALEVVSIG